MENKSTSSKLPTALRLGNTVTTDKSMLIDHIKKHFSMVGHAFQLATPTPANSSAPPQKLAQVPSTSPSPKADVLNELKNLDPYK
jgi:hypothetical protein